MDPIYYGWMLDASGQSLVPIIVALQVQPAFLLNMIKCSCASNGSYKGRCGCNQAKLPCTMFCIRQGVVAGCFNPQTKSDLMNSAGGDDGE